MNETIQNKYTDEDEIDLRELFQIIWDKKLFIFLFTAVITVCAIIWAITRTPIYEVKSNVQIGFIGEELISDPDTLVKTLNLVFNVEDKVSTKKEYLSEITSISLNKKLKNFIEIKTQAISNEEALTKNKEVVSYIKNKYKSKIEQFYLQNNNNIKTIEMKISNLENLETKNLIRQIELLKTQKIVKIDEKIKFYKNIKIKTINEKIKLHNNKLNKYKKSMENIFNNNEKIKDTSTLTVSSLEMINYQNLILNSQNKIEDLKIERETISIETIPNLEREKKNIQDDTLRNLDYKLKVELPNKKVKLLEQIEQTKFLNSAQHIQNSQVIGNYIVKDYPIKPKKKLIVVVAFVTAFILSIFIAFFLNFIANIKEKRT